MVYAKLQDKIFLEQVAIGVDNLTPQNGTIGVMVARLELHLNRVIAHQVVRQSEVFVAVARMELTVDVFQYGRVRDVLRYCELCKATLSYCYLVVVWFCWIQRAVFY